MAHKTFISYKYSEACGLRDSILNAMGDDAQYYKGENWASRDLTDTKIENIRKVLGDMIFGTTVTIVVISPHMKESIWIPWELQFSLKTTSRDGSKSHRNGIVGVIQKDRKLGYDWFRYKVTKSDGCVVSRYRTDLLCKIINANRLNQKPKQYSCPICKAVDALWGSYISLIDEDEFLRNCNFYINNAYEKSQDINGYDIHINVD